MENREIYDRKIILKGKDILDAIDYAEVAHVLFAADKLGLFKKLKEKKTFEELHKELKVEKAAFKIFLNGLIAMNIIKKIGEYYENGEAIKELIETNYIWTIKFNSYFRDPLINLYNVVKKGQKEAKEIKEDKEWYMAYAQTMSSWDEITPKILQYVDLKNAKYMLDLGGGIGHFSIAFIEKYPNLKSKIIDTGEIVELGRKDIERYKDKILLEEKDFLKDEIGSNYDFVWASDILHYLNYEEIQHLMSKIYLSLNPNGSVAIHNFILDNDTNPPAAAVFALTIPLLITKKGFVPKKKDLVYILKSAGFKDIEAKNITPGTKLIIGKK